MTVGAAGATVTLPFHSQGDTCLVNMGIDSPVYVLAVHATDLDAPDHQTVDNTCMPIMPGEKSVYNSGTCDTLLLCIDAGAPAQDILIFTGRGT